jgi:hypothetical protein
MVKIIVALRAGNTTKRSKEVRRIVKDPKKTIGGKSYKEKMLRTHEHIQQYYKDHPGAKKTGIKRPWLPSQKSLKRDPKWAIEMFTQKRGIKYFPLPNLKREDDTASNRKRISESQYSRFYNIAKRGLARSSWSWILKRLGKSGSAEQDELINTFSVRKTDTYLRESIEVSNKLSYIKKAMTQNVSTFVERATEMIEYDINKASRYSKKKAGLAA